MRLYKRIIQVIIGQEDSTALKIENLFIQIELKKQLSGKPSEGTVKIYNLAQATEDQIRDNGVRIRVLAGHNDNPILLYDGDIRRVERDRGQVDRITSISLGGNTVKLRQATFNQSYSGQVAVKQIVQDSIASFGIAAADIDEIPDDAFLYDFSFTGKTGVLLDKILNPLKVQWFEDDNFIRFSSRGKALEDVILLNKDSGLIGSPSVTDKGVKFKAVLNGRLTLNNRVKLESELVNGVYKISQLLHKGDNREGEFVTEGLGNEIE